MALAPAQAAKRPPPPDLTGMTLTAATAEAEKERTTRAATGSSRTRILPAETS